MGVTSPQKPQTLWVKMQIIEPERSWRKGFNNISARGFNFAAYASSSVQVTNVDYTFQALKTARETLVGELTTKFNAWLQTPSSAEEKRRIQDDLKNLQETVLKVVSLISRLIKTYENEKAADVQKIRDENALLQALVTGFLQESQDGLERALQPKSPQKESLQFQSQTQANAWFQRRLKSAQENYENNRSQATNFEDLKRLSKITLPPLFVSFAENIDFAFIKAQGPDLRDVYVEGVVAELKISIDSKELLELLSEAKSFCYVLTILANTARQ